MVGRFTKALVAVLLVGAMAGAAIAFAVGVQFAPDSSCSGSTVTYGSSCPKQNVADVSVKGFKILHGKGRVHLKITNHNSVTVEIALALTVKPGGGHGHFKQTFTLQPGGTLTISHKFKTSRIRRAQLGLIISDSSGDSAAISKSVGKR